MSVRTKRIALTRIVTPNVFTTVFTVPADRTLIVRCIILQNQGANATEGTVRVVNSDTGTQVRVFTDLAIATHDRRVLEQWSVLEDGDSIEVRASQTNSLNVWISGALLLGDPA